MSCINCAQAFWSSFYWKIENSFYWEFWSSLYWKMENFDLHFIEKWKIHFIEKLLKQNQSSKNKYHVPGLIIIRGELY